MTVADGSVMLNVYVVVADATEDPSVSLRAVICAADACPPRTKKLLLASTSDATILDNDLIFFVMPYSSELEASSYCFAIYQC